MIAHMQAPARPGQTAAPDGLLDIRHVVIALRVGALYRGLPEPQAEAPAIPLGPADLARAAESP